MLKKMDNGRSAGSIPKKRKGKNSSDDNLDSSSSTPEDDDESPKRIATEFSSIGSSNEEYKTFDERTIMGNNLRRYRQQPEIEVGRNLDV